MKEANKSYVLSVSLGTGCYRHIEVSAEITLKELAEIILSAFDFINLRQHAFFMDNRQFSNNDAYYSYFPEVNFDDENKRYTKDYYLRNMHLKKGDKFKFIYDFKEDWVFQCKILRVGDISTEYDNFEILKEVGDSPDMNPNHRMDEE